MWLTVANTLAYYGAAIITAVKGITEQAQGWVIFNFLIQSLYDTIFMEGTLTEGNESVQLTSLYYLCLDQLFFENANKIYFFTKQISLTRRSIVLILPPQLVFPGLWDLVSRCSLEEEWKKCKWKNNRFPGSIPHPGKLLKSNQWKILEMVCIMYKLDFGSPTKCDQIDTNDLYEFGHIYG
jgi:hypothetical protein